MGVMVQVRLQARGDPGGGVNLGAGLSVRRTPDRGVGGARPSVEAGLWAGAPGGVA